MRKEKFVWVGSGGAKGVLTVNTPAGKEGANGNQGVPAPGKMISRGLEIHLMLTAVSRREKTNVGRAKSTKGKGQEPEARAEKNANGKGSLKDCSREGETP